MANKKPTQQKAMKLFRNFVSNKRAVSVALTTLLITAGVVAAGIATLYWAYSWGDAANQQYSETVVSNQNAASERITFEYTAYSAGKLEVYLINCGQVGDVAVARVFIWNSASQLQGSYEPDPPGLMYLDGTQAESLAAGEEGYFNLTTPQFAAGYYTFRVVTERGRNFDGAFSIS